MLIGSKSTSTILDVLQTGVRELVRDVGLPVETLYKTRGCEIMLQAADMSTRVDVTQVTFPLKNDATREAIEAAIAETGIGVNLNISNGACALTLPPFEWHQAPQLVPIDTLIERFAAQSLRSQSWKVEVKNYKRHGFNVNVLIEHMKEARASDLHLRAGSAPFMRVDNDLTPLDMPTLSAADMEDIISQLGGEGELEQLRADLETSFQFHSAGIGYLRISGYFKQGAMALAIRLIPEEAPSFTEIGLPPVVQEMANSHRGLIMVAGVTGSGKSTTLAAMLDYINQTRHAHIITVEDPIEYVFKDKKAIISQRQVGRDTHSFANALRGALREDPDIIMVGEMRDKETIRSAISAAETGHLVLSTIHTMSAMDTVNRIISFFPPAERDVIRQQLAFTLRGVVCQRLLRHASGVGRVPCLEILLGGKPIVREAIIEGELGRLRDIIEGDSEMQIFDQYAIELFKNDIIDKDETISACSDLEAFLRITSGIKSSEGRKLMK